MLKASADLQFFTDVKNQKGSPADAAAKLHESMEEKGGLFGEDKRLIREAMSHMSAEGVTLAPSDVPADVAEFAADPIAKQAFSIQFNNLTMKSIVKNSLRLPLTVYQDEFKAILEFN